ncbi:DUF3325 domain-containing protein [Sphingomonas xinjiangensis]|uniref:DUF3325 domain-containing protein n=1 Tax=Sphingomonas xinjiangensis TaxID=643568 RepID=A0A840YK80_9SPHN|nr:DUF3325 domain-containing protein [Sphingomonas xinjiangensis]MBB5709476.1 hypothetical protein [Sphingomonas xinjiangensis]
MSALALLLITAAFALFGLATDPHHRVRFGRIPRAARKRQLRLGAWAALAFAFPLSVGARGWIMGSILWSGYVMLGAGLVFLALNFLPVSGTTYFAKRD